MAIWSLENDGFSRSFKDPYQHLPLCCSCATNRYRGFNVPCHSGMKPPPTYLQVITLTAVATYRVEFRRRC